MSEEMKKNKREITPEVDFIKKKFDKHLLNKFKYIKGWEELPKVFRRLFGSGNSEDAFKRYSQMGEWFLIDSEGKRYLAHVGQTEFKLVDESDEEIQPSKLEREMKLNLLGVTLRDIFKIVKKKREQEDNRRDKNIVTVTESELINIIKRIIKEEHNRGKM